MLEAVPQGQNPRQALAGNRQRQRHQSTPPGLLEDCRLLGAGDANLMPSGLHAGGFIQHTYFLSTPTAGGFGMQY
jgi:hypothetical protein